MNSTSKNMTICKARHTQFDKFHPAQSTNLMQPMCAVLLFLANVESLGPGQVSERISNKYCFVACRFGGLMQSVEKAICFLTITLRGSDQEMLVCRT